jgi:ATP-binding cassette, subfamily C (CFTR/MRP), member 1
MSTDCERIVRGLTVLHELWANVVQVALATWLIERELGIACIAPIVVTVGKFTPVQRGIMIVL